jgi:hypothetical protein
VLTVPADELARHGLRPGTHVRLIPKRPSPASRHIVRGALRAAVDARTLDAFEAALDEAKADRIAAVDRR